MDICLITIDNNLNKSLQPKSAIGMLWLQTHFENDQWEALSNSTVIISEENKVLGINPEHHDFSGLDVPLRSHGGISEQIVPLISSRPFRTDGTKNGKLRNFDAFHVGLNLT